MLSLLLSTISYTVLLLERAEPSPSPSAESYLFWEDDLCDPRLGRISCVRRKWEQMYSDLFTF